MRGESSVAACLGQPWLSDFDCKAMEEFLNWAWRDQRTAEKRDIFGEEEDHQEGGAQVCSLSTRSLQWEKVRV